MGFGSLGTGEILLILVIVLLLFGAKRLPEVGRSLGRGIREFKNATKEITSEMTDEDKTTVKPRPREDVEPRSPEVKSP
jgi:sec-independent protein translocase protein TatA